MTAFTLSIEGADCTIWPEGPDWAGTRAAAIGRLDIPGTEAGHALLTEARRQLAALGHAAVLAPMDGDTWHAYRAVTESDGTPPFLLEPASGAHDVAALTAAGFAPVSHYVSGRTTLIPSASASKPTVDGVTVRAWDGTGASALLDRLFALAQGSFADKLFFKAIAREDFLALYLPLLDRIDPRLILFAYGADGSFCGFLFGLPDWTQGPQPKTAILKTYASLRHGVGHLLAHEFHERAAALDYRDVVHALMHVDNPSLDRSAKHGGQIFRRYTLFGARGGA